MPFVYAQKVMFRHCDSAGIVFYPRFFEMMNDTVEAFFDQIAGLPFAAMQQTSGVPTVQIEAQFQAPSRLGDDLDITLTCGKLGRTSLGLRYDARCAKEARFTGASTIVFIDGKGKPNQWPEDVRHRIDTHIRGDA